MPASGGKNPKECCTPPKHCARKFACALTAVPLLLLSVICLVATITVAAIGVELANNVNQCSSANVANNTICENLSTLGGRATILNNTSTTDPPVEGSNTLQPVNEREYLYWLAGATGVGVVWSVVNTFALWVLMHVLVWFHEKEKEEKLEEEKDAVEMKSMTKDNEGGNDYTDGTPDLIDTIGKDEVHEWEATPVRNFNLLSLVTLFFGCLWFIVAVLLLLWGVAISFNHSRRRQRTVDAYIAVELIVAIFLPMFLFASAIFFAIVLKFITVGHVDGRKGIKRFLPSVSFLEGEKNDYWVIEDTFYFPLGKKPQHLENGCWYSIDRSWSTWFLVVIVCESFHLTISYFVDITLDQQVTVGGCTDPRIDRSFDCFHAGNLDFVDCTDENETFVANATLHCFRFYRFGVDVDLISSLATAFAFYLATVGIFATIFSVIKILLHIKRSKLWGIGFLLFGILAFIAAIVVSIIWWNGYLSDKVGELRRLNVINIIQLFMVAVLFLMIGLLLLIGEWYTKLNPKDPKGKDLPLDGIGTSDSKSDNEETSTTLSQEPQAADISA